jgi:adenine phosphoribosyltransferase
MVLAIEARGFLFGAPLARVLGAGIVPVRKPGKLPGRVLEQRYTLEYGEDALQVQADAVPPGARVLLVDDVLATGGTLAAARLLAEQLGADVVGAAVLIELGFLHGRARWNATAPLRAALLV